MDSLEKLVQQIAAKPAAGFQHTDYAQHLFNIALNLQNEIPRQQIADFKHILFNEAVAYKTRYNTVINSDTYDAWRNEIIKLVEKMLKTNR